MFKICPECESKWLDGQLYWATGKTGCPHDLAGLLCNDINSESLKKSPKGNKLSEWEEKLKKLEQLK